MPQGLNGLSDQTFEHLVLDAGAAYFNIDITALENGGAGDFKTAVENAIANAIPAGATRGGSVFTTGRTLREVEADGQLGPTKGLLRRTEVRPALTINFLEQTIDNIKRQFPGAVDSAAGVWRKITGGPITPETYIDNVALITTYGEEGAYAVFVVHNALVLESPEFATEDKNEVATEATFIGCFSGANSAEPWAVYLPPASSS